MIDQLQQLGVNPNQIRRVWAFSRRAWGRAHPRMGPTDESGNALRDYAGRVVEWDYHVAPAVLAGGPGGTPVLRVLDPSLLGHPAGTDLWHQRAGTPLQQAMTAQVTELGVAPLELLKNNLNKTDCRINQDVEGGWCSSTRRETCSV